MDNLLEVRNLSKSFGALKATDDVSLTLRAGEIHALIGPNGAGKSTLIKQIAGGLKSDAGSVHFAGQDVTSLSTVQRARAGLGRTFQISSLAMDYSERGKGIGSALIKRGLEAAKSQGFQLCFVIGAPEIYRRFGFCNAYHLGFRMPVYEKPRKFQVLELRYGALSYYRGGGLLSAKQSTELE